MRGSSSELPDYLIKLQMMSNSEKAKLEKKIRPRFVKLLEEVLYSNTGKQFKFASKLAIKHMNDAQFEEAFKGLFLR